MTDLARIDIRVKPEIKQLAERAAVLSGASLTHYLEQLIKADAPKRINEQHSIQLNNAQYEQFMAICERVDQPSEALKKAAKILTEKSYQKKNNEIS